MADGSVCRVISLFPSGLLQCVIDLLKKGLNIFWAFDELVYCVGG